MTLTDDQLKGLAERLEVERIVNDGGKRAWLVRFGVGDMDNWSDGDLLLAILDRAAEMGPMEAIKVANEIQAEIWSAAIMKRRPQFLYAARTALMQLPVKP